MPVGSVVARKISGLAGYYFSSLLSPLVSFSLRTNLEDEL
jgi:hypothetical protein